MTLPQFATRAFEGTRLNSRGALYAVYLFAVTLVLYVLFSNWAYDDPFITFRYANNLRLGLGFVYNPGEQVLSTTTPLFALLLAVLGNLWSDLPRLSVLIGAFSLGTGAICIDNLARAWDERWVGWAALVLYPTFALLPNAFGSEMPFFLALCLGAYTAYARGRYPAAAVLGALAVLTRADGIIVAALLAGDYLWRVRRPIPWSSVALFAAVTLPWFVFALLYFGSPFPATLAAKQHQGAMVISQSFAMGALQLFQAYTTLGTYVGETFLAVVGLVFVAVRARNWLSLLLWPLLYFVGYTLLGVSSYFWYYTVLVPGLVVLIGLGLAALWTVWGHLASTRRQYAGAAAVLVLLALGIAQTGDVARLAQTPDRRGGIYRAVGTWLDTNTPAYARVGALEIGMIGYYTHNPIVDFAGLIQPAVAAQLARNTTYEDAAIWAVEQYHPDYLVLFDGAFQRLEQGWTARECVAQQRFSGQAYGFGSDLTIYACNR